MKLVHLVLVIVLGGITLFSNSSFARTTVEDLKLRTSCLTPEEIAVEVDIFTLQVAPLLQTVPLPVSITYGAMAGFNISGYALFNDPKEIKVQLFGNNCRNLLDRDGLKLLLCHEMGHMAAGEPFMSFLGDSNVLPVSAEGQADFFATSSCLPAVWGAEDNSAFLKEEINYPELSAVCTETDDKARALCIRMALASLRFATYVHPTEATGSSPPKDPGPRPVLNIPSKTVVTKTLVREYPTAQCRLDTYLAGIRCQAKTPLSNFTVNATSEMSCGVTADLSPRPACWFKAE